MTYEESIPLAKQLATNSLAKGFDVEAFIILTLLNKEQPVDIVPESKVDEKIQDIMNCFTRYFYNRSTDNLDNLLSTIHKMLSELYHTVETEQERQLFRQHLQTLSNI